MRNKNKSEQRAAPKNTRQTSRVDTNTASKRRWKLHSTIESKALRIPTNTIQSIARRVLSEVSHEIAIPDVCELHIMIVNDARMREINFEFRHKDKPTDVLSFPQFIPDEIRGLKPLSSSPSPYLGDLVISSETTRRQAKRFEVTVQAEVVRLITHGILHLIGYDHEGVPAREAQAMRRRERIIRESVAQWLCSKKKSR